MEKSILLNACNYAKEFKGNTVDIENRIITMPFSKGFTMDDISWFSEQGLIHWYINNGFNVSFDVHDVEYYTKATVTSRSLIYNKPHKAYLRNRLVATITW